MSKRNSKAAESISKEHYRSGGGLTATFGCGDERVVRVYRGTFRYIGKRRGRVGREVASHSIAEHAAQAVADCRALGPDWRILSLSTPSTIYRDLAGRDGKQTPEANLVARADHDVLAPTLLGHDPKAERERRKASAA